MNQSPSSLLEASENSKKPRSRNTVSARINMGEPRELVGYPGQVANNSVHSSNIKSSRLSQSPENTNKESEFSIKGIMRSSGLNASVRSETNKALQSQVSFQGEKNKESPSRPSNIPSRDTIKASADQRKEKSYRPPARTDLEKYYTADDSLAMDLKRLNLSLKKEHLEVYNRRIGNKKAAFLTSLPVPVNMTSSILGILQERPVLEKQIQALIEANLLLTKEKNKALDEVDRLNEQVSSYQEKLAASNSKLESLSNELFELKVRLVDYETSAEDGSFQANQLKQLQEKDEIIREQEERYVELENTKNILNDTVLDLYDEIEKYQKCFRIVKKLIGPFSFASMFPDSDSKSQSNENYSEIKAEFINEVEQFPLAGQTPEEQGEKANGSLKEEEMSENEKIEKEEMEKRELDEAEELSQRTEKKLIKIAMDSKIGICLFSFLDKASMVRVLNLTKNMKQNLKCEFIPALILAPQLQADFEKASKRLKELEEIVNFNSIFEVCSNSMKSLLAKYLGTKMPYKVGMHLVQSLKEFQIAIESAKFHIPKPEPPPLLPPQENSSFHSNTLSRSSLPVNPSSSASEPRRVTFTKAGNTPLATENNGQPTEAGASENKKEKKKKDKSDPNYYKEKQERRERREKRRQEKEAAMALALQSQTTSITASVSTTASNSQKGSFVAPFQLEPQTGLSKFQSLFNKGKEAASSLVNKAQAQAAQVGLGPILLKDLPPLPPNPKEEPKSLSSSAIALTPLTAQASEKPAKPAPPPATKIVQPPIQKINYKTVKTQPKTYFMVERSDCERQMIDGILSYLKENKIESILENPTNWEEFLELKSHLTRGLSEEQRDGLVTIEAQAVREFVNSCEFALFELLELTDLGLILMDEYQKAVGGMYEMDKLVEMKNGELAKAQSNLESVKSKCIYYEKDNANLKKSLAEFKGKVKPVEKEVKNCRMQLQMAETQKNEAILKLKLLVKEVFPLHS